MMRTRFAPSPTGYLHVGGARTALYSYLLARQSGGQFILRIEDTDLERSSESSINAILQGMTWLELDYDEGPFFQTQRFDRYREVAQQLLEEGHAYRCDCSHDRIEALRTAQMQSGVKPRYDGHCRSRHDIDDTKPHVIRFKNPQTGSVSWHDLVKGEISFANEELDDLIIMRSDHTPTYNFTVVVDDFEMKITHVVRGDDHVNNTPRQINILKALKSPLPHYAHVPMILGGDGKRLSKRHGAVSVMAYQEEGYLKEALLNYLLRLGFGFGDKEIFSREEMIALFDIKKVSHSPAVFDVQKLNWLNQHYLKTLPFEHLEPEILAVCRAQKLEVAPGPKLKAVYELVVPRLTLLNEFVIKSRYFFEAPHYDETLKAAYLNAETKPILEKVQTVLAALALWQKAEIHGAIDATAKALNLGMGKVAMPLRFTVTGSKESPSIDATLELIGRDESLKRLQHVLETMAC